MRLPHPLSALSLMIAMPLVVLASSNAVASDAEGGSRTGSRSGDTGVAPHFVAMDVLDVPIVEGNRADGRLKLKLVLEAVDAERGKDIDARLPELREAALVSAIEFARLHASPSAPVDAQVLANDVSAALRTIDPAIAAVLVVEVAAKRV